MDGSFSRSGEDAEGAGAAAVSSAEREPEPVPGREPVQAAPPGRGRKLRAGLGRPVSRDRVLELTHAGTERATDLREPLGTEQEQGQTEQQNDFHGADVGHGRIVAAVFRGGATRSRVPCRGTSTDHPVDEVSGYDSPDTTSRAISFRSPP